MDTKYGVEYWPSEKEGSHWQELDPMDFIKLVQSAPHCNVDYCYETKTFTFWDEYNIYLKES